MLTFFIVLFVLIVQFLWKYVDDLVGKGLEATVIIELLFYASAALVPLALPLSVLLASIMTFGRIGEYFELTAIKSSGISLNRFMTPLLGFVILISLGAFVFSNNILPIANLKFGALLYDVREQKPALQLKEGIFYDGFDGYRIRIGSKGKEDQSIQDVLIYDHSDNRGNIKVLSAASGEMYQSENKRYLILKLYNGTLYEEVIPEVYGSLERKHMRTHFGEQEIKFDLSPFQLERTDEDLFKSHQNMLNVVQLRSTIDSLSTDRNTRFSDVRRFVRNYYFWKSDSVYYVTSVSDTVLNGTVSSWFHNSDNIGALQSAIANTQTILGYTSMLVRENETRKDNIVRFVIEFHRKFSLSLACLVLFLVGAPLGAIVKKGGLGMPMVLSILLFLTYYIISSSAEKNAKFGDFDADFAMWISTIVLLPVGLFLLYKANAETKFFDFGGFFEIIRIKNSVKSK